MAAVIRKRYKNLDHDNLVNVMIAIQNLQMLHIKNKTADIQQLKDEKKKFSKITKSIHTPKTSERWKYISFG